MELLERLKARGAMIERLASDSRRCAPGTCFFAWPGERGDGRRHIAQAIARGASAVLWEAEGFAWRDEWSVPNEPVADLRNRAGFLAHGFYGRPSESMWVCGVTGTNGKTSCSQWLAALLGPNTGIIGTLGSGFPGALSEAANTTPDALEVHKILSDMKKAGAPATVMEVSSHGLVQGRVNGVAFDCALFTNLSHDHLDYHGSMQAYGEAKARLFETPGLAAAVLNLDDVMGVELARRLAGRVRTIGYSLSRSAIAPGSVSEWVAASAIAPGRIGIESAWGAAETAFPALGRFNVSNALGVLGCLVASGVPFRDAAARLAQVPAVPGRLQRLGGDARPLVVIDYAHTPDAFEKVLAALRPVAEARGGRLAIVFGAGGERDPSKRPLMGAAAARGADRIVLTSDNPRGEDPLAIIAAVRSGVVSGEVVEEPDRGRAIARAVAQADAADVILLAGKGHEPYQEIAGVRRPFSDANEARRALDAWARR